MREADPRTKQALQRLVRHESLQVKVLAADLHVSLATIYSWANPDGPTPTLSQVRQLVWAAAAYDGAAARELAAEVFGLSDAGWVVGAAPRPAPGVVDLVHEVMEAGAASGAVTGWAAKAGSDRYISPSEADEGLALIQANLRELAEAKAVIERFRAPQLAWRMAGVPA